MADKKPQFSIKVKKPDMWTDRSMTVFANALAEPSDKLETNVVITRETMAKTKTFKSYIKRQKKLWARKYLNSIYLKAEMENLMVKMLST